MTPARFADRHSIARSVVSVPAVAGAWSSSRRSGREARRNIDPSRRPSTAHDPATALPARHDRSDRPPWPGSAVRVRQGRSIIRARRQPIRRAPPPDARSRPRRQHHARRPRPLRGPRRPSRRRRFPIGLPEPSAHCPRDFVPWRFSDAGKRRAQLKRRHTASEKPAQQRT